MPQIIQISQTAYDLWNGMLKKGGLFSNDDLKKLAGAAYSKTLKDELTTAKLMKLQTSKPRQIYTPLAKDFNVEIKIKAEEKPKKPPSKPKKEEIKFSDIMTQVSKYCQPYFDKIDTLTSEIENIKIKLKEYNDNLNTIYSRTQSMGQTKPMIKEVNQSELNEFLKVLQLSSKKLDATSRFGGQIPIYEIWNLIKNEQSQIDRNLFQNYLLQLEKVRKIDLHIANDPLNVRYPDSGINISGRGLIYYLSLRS